MRSSVARRISVRLSAAATGESPSRSRRARTNRSISVFGHAVFCTAGTAGFGERLEGPERAQRRDRLAVRRRSARVQRPSRASRWPPATAPPSVSTRQAPKSGRRRAWARSVAFSKCLPRDGPPSSAGSRRDLRARSPDPTPLPSTPPAGNQGAAPPFRPPCGSRSRTRRAADALWSRKTRSAVR